MDAGNQSIILQGWINLFIQVVLAIGTLIIAALAIWGDKIRHILSGPKLRLRLNSVDGEFNTTNPGRKARYYHFYLENLRPHAAAQKVKVMLRCMYRPLPNGRFGPTNLVSPIQFTYQFPTMPGHDARPTIGSSPVLCDLGFLLEGQPFIFTTYFIPNNFEPRVQSGQKVRIQARAEGDNAMSNDVCIEVAWDGNWHEGTTEIQRHLVVREVPSPTQ